ncbi:MAG: hypothetical protein GQ527_09495 [Bacteroidales bacterium]|nr:hypothetical protein [Bacteroidales bacterium]
MVIAGWAIGQTVKVDGEIRPRAELRNGYKKLPATDAEAAFAISQRTRFNAFYGSKVFKAYVSMQDVRVWGDVNQLDNGAYNKFAVHQAWGEYFFTENISFKVGRQELVYDDSRILGNVGWAQQARAHDLGLFKFEKENFKVHFGLAFNQKSEGLAGTDYYAGMNADGTYSFNKNYKAMQFLWFNTKIGKSGLSVLFLNNGMESASYTYDNVGMVETTEFKTLYSQTIGARFTPTLGPVGLAAAVYYQMGTVGNEDTKLSAMYFALAGTIKVGEKASVTGGFEYLSGTSLKDKTEDPETMKSFTPLYGTNHKFNGHMDYFFVGNHGGNVGLIDIYATLKMKLGKGWSVFATPHYFMAAADVYQLKSTDKADFDESNYNNLSKGLGIEIDMGITYAPQKNMKLSLGISEMLGTETLGYIQGYSSTDAYSANGTWAYLMFVFKPNFYTSK